MPSDLMDSKSPLLMPSLMISESSNGKPRVSTLFIAARNNVDNAKFLCGFK
jgi:hypothetical protein